jgi:Zn-dependent protease with chaperone function
VQLLVGDIRTQADWQRAVALIDQEDDSFANQLGEMLSTHPLIIKRIKELRDWSVTDEYRLLQTRVLPVINY